MAAPVNTVVPALSGALKTRATLTFVAGTWTGSPDSLAYQLERAMPVVDDDGEFVIDDGDGEVVTDDWEEIPGATGLTYVSLGDAGHFVRLRETATNGDGSTVAYSIQQGPIVSFPRGPESTAVSLSTSLNDPYEDDEE